MLRGRRGGDGFLCQKISMLNDTKIIIVITTVKHSNKTELPKHNMACFTMDIISYLIFFYKATPIIKLSWSSTDECHWDCKRVKGNQVKKECSVDIPGYYSNNNKGVEKFK